MAAPRIDLLNWVKVRSQASTDQCPPDHDERTTGHEGTKPQMGQVLTCWVAGDHQVDAGHYKWATIGNNAGSVQYGSKGLFFATGHLRDESIW